MFAEAPFSRYTQIKTRCWLWCAQNLDMPVMDFSLTRVNLLNNSLNRLFYNFPSFLVMKCCLILNKKLTDIVPSKRRWVKTVRRLKGKIKDWFACMQMSSNTLVPHTQPPQTFGNLCVIRSVFIGIRLAWHPGWGVAFSLSVLWMFQKQTFFFLSRSARSLMFSSCGACMARWSEFLIYEDITRKLLSKHISPLRLAWKSHSGRETQRFGFQKR